MCRTIADDFEEKEPLIIGTLNGAFVFMAGESVHSDGFLCKELRLTGLVTGTYLCGLQKSMVMVSAIVIWADGCIHTTTQTCLRAGFYMQY